MFTNESDFKNGSRKAAKNAKKNLCDLGVLARGNVFFIPYQSEV